MTSLLNQTSVADDLRQIDDLRNKLKSIQLGGVVDVILKPHKVELVLEVSKGNISHCDDEIQGINKRRKKLQTYLRCNPKIVAFAEQENLSLEPVVRPVTYHEYAGSVQYGSFIVFTCQ
jgi:hypothetical protein